MPTENLPRFISLAMLFKFMTTILVSVFEKPPPRICSIFTAWLKPAVIRLFLVANKISAGNVLICGWFTSLAACLGMPLKLLSYRNRIFRKFSGHFDPFRTTDQRNFVSSIFFSSFFRFHFRSTALHSHSIGDCTNIRQRILTRKTKISSLILMHSKWLF